MLKAYDVVQEDMVTLNKEKDRRVSMGRLIGTDQGQFGVNSSTRTACNIFFKPINADEYNPP